MFQCSFSTLPKEFLFNPFYWERNYEGLTSYLNCAKSRNVTMTTVLGCYKLLENECPLPLNVNSKPCYQSLHDARQRKAVNILKKSQQLENSFDRYITCMTHMYHQITPCISRMEDACKSAATRAVKAIRLNLSFVRQLLAINPTIKIVHLVRDPRGMLLSSKKIPNRALTVTLSTSVCQRLLANIESFQWVDENFPGSSLQIRYEDLAVDLQKVASAVYNHVGIHSKLKSDYLSSWLNKITSSVNNVGAFRTFRSNSTAEAYDWMTQLNVSDRKLIESVPECTTSINKLNYPKILPDS